MSHQPTNFDHDACAIFCLRSITGLLPDDILMRECAVTIGNGEALVTLDVEDIVQLVNEYTLTFMTVPNKKHPVIYIGSRKPEDD